MKKNKKRVWLLAVSILVLLVFCSCSVTIDFSNPSHDITIHNNVAWNIQVSINEGASTEFIPSGGQITLHLEEGTSMVVHIAGNPASKFHVDDITGLYTFVLDGAGYTLFAELGIINIFRLRVTRVV
ncbi:MAG: hypothetical protein ACLFQE_04495 [Thermotogota bacterium]